MLIARVNIETAKGTYRPGDAILEDLGRADIDYLSKRSFIAIEEDIPDPPAVISEDGSGNGNSIAHKDEAALKKMNKEEILGYAAEIGLELEPETLKNDMIASVLDHTERMEDR